MSSGRPRPSSPDVGCVQADIKPQLRPFGDVSKNRADFLSVVRKKLHQTMCCPPHVSYNAGGFRPFDQRRQCLVGDFPVGEVSVFPHGDFHRLRSVRDSHDFASLCVQTPHASRTRWKSVGHIQDGGIRNHEVMSRQCPDSLRRLPVFGLRPSVRAGDDGAVRQHPVMDADARQVEQCGMVDVRERPRHLALTVTSVLIPDRQQPFAAAGGKLLPRQGMRGRCDA